MDFVIIVEFSAGNAEVGNMWQETLVCPQSITLEQVWMWVQEKTQKGCRGRIMITEAQSMPQPPE